MKSLNASDVIVETTENDRKHLANLATRLSLMKRLLRTFISNDGEGFSLNPTDLEVKTFILKKNKSKEANREVLWKSIGKCSRFEDQWKRFF